MGRLYELPSRKSDKMESHDTNKDSKAWEPYGSWAFSGSEEGR